MSHTQVLHAGFITSAIGLVLMFAGLLLCMLAPRWRWLAYGGAGVLVAGFDVFGVALRAPTMLVPTVLFVVVITIAEFTIRTQKRV